MSNSVVHLSAINLWNDLEFHRHYKNLKLANVRSNLNPVYQAEEEIDFPNLFRAASLFSLVKHTEKDCDRFHEAAFRIAYIAKKIWTDCPDELSNISALILSRLGNFPTIGKQLANDNLTSFLSDFMGKLPHSFALETLARYEGNTVKLQTSHGSKQDTLLELTDFQRKLWEGLYNERSLLSFSSPTSSGKTFLLQKFLVDTSSKSMNAFRAIYIVPTRALIGEISLTLRDLLHNNKVEDVEVLSISGDLEDDLPDKVIYVFTQERLLSFLANVPPKKLSCIDYIVVDEAHQISEKARGALLHQSLNWLKYSYRVEKFIFCSPVISNPKIFGNLLTRGADFSSESYLTEISPVAQNLLVVKPIKGKTDVLEIALHDNEGERLIVSDEFELLQKREKTSKAYFLAYCAFHLGKDKRNIIYVDGPAAADNVAEELMKLINSESSEENIDELSRYIKKSIHSDFILAESLKYRIGIHYGKMPSLVRETVERLFREERLDFIICTSTLAQGVNLPAQNLFILDPKVKNYDTNTQESISKAAFWNIVGRAGRLYKDFEGNVFLLKQPLEKDNWEEQYLNEEKLSAVIPATQAVITEQRDSLIEHLVNPESDAQKGIEEAASFVYDLANSNQAMNKELSWIPNLEEHTVNELVLSTQKAEKQITLPHVVIKKNVGVSPVRQQVLYDFLLKQPTLEEWILPRNLASSADFHRIVTQIIGILDAPSMDEYALKKYAWVFTIPALDWIRGTPLNQMITKHLKHVKKRKAAKSLTVKKINSGIRELFENIETNVRFKLVKYINCYNNILVEACHQKNKAELIEKIPMHLALFLEVGASNSTQLNLISLGLSRITAIEVAKKIEGVAAKTSKELNMELKKLLNKKADLPLACIEEIKRCIF